MFDISKRFMRVLFVLLFIYHLNVLLVTCAYKSICQAVPVNAVSALSSVLYFVLSHHLLYDIFMTQTR